MDSPRKNFVSSLHEAFHQQKSFNPPTTTTKKQILPTTPFVAHHNVLVAKGGFGHIYETLFTFFSQNEEGGGGNDEDDQKQQSNIIIITKHIQPQYGDRASQKENGSEAFNEMAIMSFISKTPERHSSHFKYLMPSLFTSFDLKTSAVQIGLPPGISDVAKIVRKNNIRLTDKTFRKWSSELVSAVASLHSLGVVHGDIKPGNIIIFPDLPSFSSSSPEEEGLSETIKRYLRQLNADEIVEEKEKEKIRESISKLLEFTTIRLSDFGLSSFCVRESSGADEVVDQGILGYSYTSCYRPPEIWKRNKWGLSSDMWALGCTLYEMRFNKLLFATSAKINYHLEKNAFFDERKSNLKAQEEFVKAFDFLANKEPKGEIKKDPSFSRELFEILGSCLQISPYERIEIVDLIEHPFFDEKIIRSVKYVVRGCCDGGDGGGDGGDGDDKEKDIIELQREGVSSLPAHIFLLKELDIGEKRVKSFVLKRSKETFPEDSLVAKSVQTLVLKIVEKQKTFKSVRVRKMTLDMLIAFCGCIVSKITKRMFTFQVAMTFLKTLKYGGGSFVGSDEDYKNLSHPKKASSSSASGSSAPVVGMTTGGIANSLLPPCLARDEKLICDAIGFDIFPFEEKIRFQ